MFIRIVLVFLALTGFANAADTTNWQDDSNSKGVLIQSRSRAGSPVREFRAIGLIDAPSSRVFALLSDVEKYPTFMPYVSECRIVRREPSALVFYQRLSLPLIHDRDFTLRSRRTQTSNESGTTYRSEWQPANDLAPPPVRGVVRVTHCEGSWLLEPASKSSTRATYTIYTDSGGALPAFVENSGSRIAIRKLFEAVRKRLKDSTPSE